MNILMYLVSPGGMTGAPKRLLNLASSIKAEGLTPIVGTEAGSELYKCAKQAGIEAQDISAHGVLRLRRGALFKREGVFFLKVLYSLVLHNLKFYKTVWKSHAGVIWIRGSKGIAFAGLGAFLSRRPMIWDVDYELPSKGAIRHLHRFALWNANKVIFQYSSAPVDIFGHELFLRHKDKFLTIIPGIDLCALSEFRAKRCESLVKDRSSFVIMQVGTVCDRKNQKYLISALSSLDVDFKSVRIVVKFVGGVFDEDYFESLKHEIRNNDFGVGFEFLGWRDDVHALMCDADLLVMPSKDEGVPNAVQEAMYIGLPVMVSDVGGMPEIVNKNETGWVLPLDDAKAWAETIAWCISNPDECKQIGRQASVYAEKYFRLWAWGRTYANEIMSLCDD